MNGPTDRKQLTADIIAALHRLYSNGIELEKLCDAKYAQYTAMAFFTCLVNNSPCNCVCGGLRWEPAYGLGGENRSGDVLLRRAEGTGRDVCVITLAKANLSHKRAHRQLADLTGGSEGVEYGLYLQLEAEEVVLSWFKKGSVKPFSVETYRTDTWESTSFIADLPPPESRRSCTLMITRACNLNCTYCYEPFKCNDHQTDMTFETAKAILLKEFDFVRKSPTFKEIEIDFMGGEPLMNMPLIKQVVEWLEQEPPPVPFICFATTNGTLVKAHEAWLRAHTQSLQLGASYDGTTEMQRANRGTSGRCVDLELMHRLYPHQGFHMVISKETLPHLAEGILELQRKGYKLEAALAQGVDWNEADAACYQEQLEVLAKVYLKERTLKPINLLTHPLMTIADEPATVEQRKYCGTGTHMVTYDYDGKAYGCHLFTPVVLGANAQEVTHIDYTCPQNNADPFCADCRLKSVCPTCAGFNFRYRGSLGARDHRWCQMILVQMQVACLFQMKAVAQARTHTEEELALAHHALEAYPILNHFSHQAIPPYVFNHQGELQ